MKKLVLGTILMAGLLQGGAGCIISGDDDDDDVGDVTDDGDDVGQPEFLFRAEFVCPPEADEVVITPTPVGSGQSQDGEIFGCEEEFGEILFSPGDFDIEVLPVNASDDEFAAQFATITGDDGDEVVEEFIFPQDGGFFQLTWTIDGGDAELSCAEVGADTVEVAGGIPDDPKSGPFVEAFACEDGGGILPQDDLGWELGEWTIQVTLIDEFDEAISKPSDIENQFIDFAGQLADIGNVDFSTL